MSLLIASKNRNGIVFGTDSKAIDLDSSGNVQEMSVRRMVRLTEGTAILAGGAAAGIHMADTLKQFVNDEKLEGVEEVYQAALPFLASEYERFMRKTCEVVPLDPIHHVHFILGGKAINHHQYQQHQFRLYFLWTKRQMPRLDGDEIRSAFSIPRLIRLEYKLGQLYAENADLNHMLSEIRNGMLQQAEIQDEIGGPFSYAIIDDHGFRDVAA